MRASASHGFDLWGAVDGLRETLASAGGWRTPPDIRTAVLVSLLDEPLHGYGVIQAIETRTGWRPGPGEVYPTLQLLVDEQLVESAQAGERKVFSLTATGRAAAESAAEPDAASGESTRDRLERNMALPKAGAKLAQAAAAVAQSGTPEQAERAVAAIDEARRKLYAILAED